MEGNEMIYASIRVSSKDQNLARQIIAVKEYRPELLDENIYADKQSGKNFDRKEYLKLKSVLKPGDEVIIKELDRLGRNKEEIKEELKWFKEHGVIVRILNVPTTLIDFNGQEWIFDMINNILIEVMGAVAEEERKKILERQKEGIAAMPIIDGKKVSTKTGKPMGNPGKDLTEFPKFFEKTKNGELSVSESCRQLGISRTHWYRLCKGA
jgi:DNA invertase Pin-like site-specific DNA recombinase